MRSDGFGVIVCSVTFKLRYTLAIMVINYIYLVGGYADRISELAISYNSVKNNFQIKELSMGDFP